MKKIKQDCQHDYENPIHKGWAHYTCPKCKKDITMDLVLLYECNNISEFEEKFLNKK